MGIFFWMSYVLLWTVALASLAAVALMYWTIGRRSLVEKDARLMQGPVVGSRLQETRAVGVNGEELAIGGEGLVGQLIVFGAPNCSPCRTAVRELAASLTESRSDVSVTIVAVRTSVTAAAEWLGEVPHTAKMVPDPTGKLQAAYRVVAVPFAILTDETGRVTRRQPISSDWSWLAEGIVDDLANVVL